MQQMKDTLKLSTLVSLSIFALAYSSLATSSCNSVNETTLKDLQNLIDFTWNASLVGMGADAVNLSHSSLTVVTACEIKNDLLLKNYEARKQTLHIGEDLAHLPDSRGPVATEQFFFSKLERSANEHFLFHGTKSEYVHNIISSGLRTGDGGMLGAGIYTAENSTKADQYADLKTQRTPLGTQLKMLLVRILLGNIYLCTNDECAEAMRRLNKLPPSGYDSVIWNPTEPTKLFREFVLYDADQTYPQYLITYVRNSAAILPLPVVWILVLLAGISFLFV